MACRLLDAIPFSEAMLDYLQRNPCEQRSAEFE